MFFIHFIADVEYPIPTRKYRLHSELQRGAQIFPRTRGMWQCVYHPRSHLVVLNFVRRSLTACNRYPCPELKPPYLGLAVGTKLG